LCHVTLKLAVSRSRPPVPYEANLFYERNKPLNGSFVLVYQEFI